MPRLEVHVNGKTYALEFEGNADLAEKAGKLIGRTVRIKGALEERRYVVGDKLADNGVMEARFANLTVIVVDSIEEIKTDSFKEVKKMQVRGTFGWYGNHKGVGPKGEPIMTCIGFPWEGYTVTAGGKTYRLDFSRCLSAHNLDALLGQTVIVEGEYEMRVEGALPEGGPARTYGVIVVTRLTPA
jgi:hypothetical protein